MIIYQLDMITDKTLHTSNCNKENCGHWATEMQTHLRTTGGNVFHHLFIISYACPSTISHTNSVYSFNNFLSHVTVSNTISCGELP